MSKLAIIAANGTLDAAYKVFNIATAAASMGNDVAIFFTFDGLKLIHKEANQALPAPATMAGMQDALKAHNVPSIPELVAIAQELGVTFIGCQMTMDLLNLPLTDLVDGVESAGAASFLAFADGAYATLTF